MVRPIFDQFLQNFSQNPLGPNLTLQSSCANAPDMKTPLPNDRGEPGLVFGLGVNGSITSFENSSKMICNIHFTQSSSPSLSPSYSQPHSPNPFPLRIVSPLRALLPLAAPQTPTPTNMSICPIPLCLP